MSFPVLTHRTAMRRRSAAAKVESAIAGISIVAPGSKPPQRTPGLYIELVFGDGATKLLVIEPEHLKELRLSIAALEAVL